MDREAKELFSQVCVILSTGGGVSQHEFGQRGVWTGVCVDGGSCVWKGRGCGQWGCRRVVYTPLPKMATDTVSTHPTGMRSCVICIGTFFYNSIPQYSLISI